MKKIFIILLILNSVLLFGQKDCGFKIDEEKILKNENLDFFLNKLKKEKFDITNRKEDIPMHVFKQLECLNDEFTIANPNEDYQSSDIIDLDKKLPERGLIFYAKSKSTLVLYYSISIGPGITSKILFIEYNAEKITDFWCGNSMGRADVKDLEGINIIINREKKLPYPLGLQNGMIVF
ncbi:hypothetical protein [Flavobacterium celericrescens]|uniref:GLPGLI family protein n=1 Tax=Flavobacterium celericrescens TaxID=2709780 RepID=A0ABX0I915_9FLAO|nr:hypothetical protein [Flavobacterium celericrescens]NHM03668.1 hypothetical protein [Flavobacterium celericrescens]